MFFSLIISDVGSNRCVCYHPRELGGGRGRGMKSDTHTQAERGREGERKNRTPTDRRERQKIEKECLRKRLVVCYHCSFIINKESYGSLVAVNLEVRLR